MLDFIFWYLIITLAGFLALPVAYRLLPKLVDRGYAMARAIGLILWGFAFWLLTSLNILQNDTGGVLVALALLGVLGAWLAGGRQGWGEIFSFLRRKLTFVILTELLFLLAFIFLSVMRAASPDIANTEKPMELAFINSILHSPSFPPSDPWLAGYAISYYYFGYTLVSMLIRLSGVGVGVGFNLAISLWFALTALGAFGISYSLLSAWSQRRQAEGKPAILSQGWALLAPFYVLIVSNLGGFLTMLRSGGLFWQQVGGTWQSPFWQWLNIKEWATPPPQPFTWIPQGPGWWWWQSSRIVQDFRLNGDFVEVIDEFPFFSYFLADLHPHVLAMPFVLLAVGLALNLYLWGASLDFSKLSLLTLLRRLDFWLAAVVLGGLSFINTWDFPIYLALFSAAFVLVCYQQKGWHWQERFKDFLKVFILLGIVSVVLYLPFYFGFQSQAGGILPSLAFFTHGIYFWIMFAPLLIPIFVWMAWLLYHRSGSLDLASGLKFAGIIVVGLWAFSWLLGLLGAVLPALGGSMAASSSARIANLGASLTNLGNLFISNQGAASTQGLLVDAFVHRLTAPGTWLTLSILITIIWSLFASHRLPSPELSETSDQPSALSDPESDLPVPQSEFHNPQSEINDPQFAIRNPHSSIENLQSKIENPAPFILLMVLVGAGLTLVPEFVYLRDTFGSRMNTVFKFYFQTWILWGVAAATVSVFLLKELRRLSKAIFTTAWVILLALANLYPLFGIIDRLSSSPVSAWNLNGEATFAAYNPDDMAGIKWLQSAPYGTVVEAVGGQYSEYARIAIHSGLPSVLGWAYHELQWRGSLNEVGSREADIARLYSTSNWQEALTVIQQYNIRYVFIGNLERGKYKVSEAKFKAHLAPVFQSNNTVIYEVPDLILSEKGTSSTPGL
jgi:YYY domain-containing protein